MTTPEPTGPSNSVFDLPGLAWQTLEVVRDAGEPVRVNELNAQVGDRLNIVGDVLIGQDSRETDFEYNMRYARMVLVYQARAMERIPNVQGWEQEWHAYRATALANQLTKDEIPQLVTEFMASHPQGKTYRNRGYGGPLVPARQHIGGEQSPPWTYDYVEWAQCTLNVIRRICSTAPSGLQVAPNTLINEAVADELALTVDQRRVSNLRNPTEVEYKARGGTMRRLLELLELIQRSPHDKKYWMPTEQGESINKEELKERIESYFASATIALSSIGGPNWSYRGNAALEERAPTKGDSIERLETQAEGEPQIAVLGDASAESTDTTGAGFRLADIDLCVATLGALQANSMDDAGIEQSDLVNAVGEQINIPEEYLSLPGPPWGRRLRNIDNLFSYRMEHVLRSLSVEPANLIQVQNGTDGDEIAGDWSLTRKGERFSTQYRDQAEFTTEVQKLVSDYFEVHSYEDWRFEEWMQEYYEYLGGVAGRDGTPFEHLCAEIMRSSSGFAVVQVQEKNSALGHEGVDIVAKAQISDTALELANFGNVPVYEVQEVVWFAQCKMWLTEDAKGDAVSKIHGYWIDQQSRSDANGGYGTYIDKCAQRYY
ncbi:MAG: hypothetical protein F4X94_07550 [Dehalococcoidia bacterium]|nr:hypothetical protein [Dehalococcoidia bacterium]